jgi:asparagine synthase (glutamine-hydrolysing)
LITCLNQYGFGPGEDERVYARIAAARARVPLIEREWHGHESALDQRLLLVPKAVKPTIPGVFGLLDLEVRNEVARSVNADAVWTGQGGDHLFFQIPTILGAADFLQSRGLRTGLLAAVTDSSQLVRTPYLQVLRSTFAAQRTYTDWRPDNLRNVQSAFISPDAFPSDLQTYISHPWTIGGGDLPKGKQLQIYYLAELANRHRPLYGLEYAEEHHPLISQPIITACLRIPIYLLTKGGRPRALAKATFADYVAPEILARDDKGNTTSQGMRTILRSTSFLSELLMDGILATNGIISGEMLEPYLREMRPLSQQQYFPLLACIAAEVWARNWAPSRLRAVA